MSHKFLQRVLSRVILITLVGFLNSSVKAQDLIDYWSEPEVVSTLGQNPSIDVDDSGNAYVVWSDGYNLHFRKRSANGTWQPVEQVATYPIAASNHFEAIMGYDPQMAPSALNINSRIAVDNTGRAYVAWINRSNYPVSQISLRLRTRTANGVWGPEEIVAQAPLGQGPLEAEPGLAVDAAGNVYVVWQDEASSQSKLRIRSIAVRGAAWSR